MAISLNVSFVFICVSYYLCSVTSYYYLSPNNNQMCCFFEADSSAFWTAPLDSGCVRWHVPEGLSLNKASERLPLLWLLSGFSSLGLRCSLHCGHDAKHEAVLPQPTQSNMKRASRDWPCQHVGQPRSMFVKPFTHLLGVGRAQNCRQGNLRLQGVITNMHNNWPRCIILLYRDQKRQWPLDLHYTNGTSRWSVVEERTLLISAETDRQTDFEDFCALRFHNYGTD